MKKIKTGWHLVEKSFQGGVDEYAFRATKETVVNFGDYESLMEYIGENTTGGHSYGYRIKMTHKNTKPKNKKTLRFGSVLGLKIS